MAPTKQGGAPLPVFITNGSNEPVATIPALSSVQIIEQKTYATVKTGELAGSATVVQMPSISCKLVKFKALADNTGNVYIGGSSVSVANGATDTTTGYELDAGEETGWIPVDNLSRFYRICNNAGDDLTYLALE